MTPSSSPALKTAWGCVSILAAIALGWVSALGLLGPGKLKGVEFMGKETGTVVGAGPLDVDADLLADVAGAEVMGGEFWSPEKTGDTVVGEILVDDIVDGQFGKQRVLQLAVDNDTVCVAVNASLARELGAQKVKLGDRIAVQYRGTVKTKQNRDFKTYVVRKAK